MLLALCLLSTAALADSASPWAYDENNLVLRLVGEVNGMCLSRRRRMAIRSTPSRRTPSPVRLSIEDMTPPSTMKAIGDSTFEGAYCQELYLSGNLERIGFRAFSDTPLNYLVFDFYAPIDIAADAFADTCAADLNLPWDSSFENHNAYAAMLRDQCPECTVWINNTSSSGVAEDRSTNRRSPPFRTAYGRSITASRRL